MKNSENSILKQIDVDGTTYPFLDRTIFQISSLLTTILSVGQDSIEQSIKIHAGDCSQLYNILERIRIKLDKNGNYFLGELVNDLKKENVNEETINLILLELGLPQEYISDYDKQTKLVLTIKS